MRRILICTGILGGGTALTFAAAAFAATLLPGGTVIPGNALMVERGWAKPMPAVEMPAPWIPDVEQDPGWDEAPGVDTGSAVNEG